MCQIYGLRERKIKSLHSEWEKIHKVGHMLNWWGLGKLREDGCRRGLLKKITVKSWAPQKRCGVPEKNVWVDAKRFLKPSKKVWVPWKRCEPQDKIVWHQGKGWYARHGVSHLKKGAGRRRKKVRASEEKVRGAGGKGAGRRRKRCGASEEKVRGVGGKGAGRRRKKVRGAGGKGAGRRRKRCGAPEEKVRGAGGKRCSNLLHHFAADNGRLQTKVELSIKCNSKEHGIGLCVICCLLRYRAGRHLASCVFVVKKEHNDFGADSSNFHDILQLVTASSPFCSLDVALSKSAPSFYTATSSARRLTCGTPTADAMGVYVEKENEKES